MRVGPKRKGKLHFRLLWEAAQPTQLTRTAKKADCLSFMSDHRAKALLIG